MQVRADTRGFKIIEKALTDNYKTRVGILGSQASASHGKGVTNAQIGTLHEFGGAGIPPRSFLRMPLETKMGEWIKKNKDWYYKLMTMGNLRKFYVAMGFAAEAIIDDAFTSSGFGSWSPLSPITIKRKGSSLPLIDTGQLRASITSKVMSDV